MKKSVWDEMQENPDRFDGFDNSTRDKARDEAAAAPHVDRVKEMVAKAKAERAAKARPKAA